MTPDEQSRKDSIMQFLYQRGMLASGDPRVIGGGAGNNVHEITRQDHGSMFVNVADTEWFCVPSDTPSATVKCKKSLGSRFQDMFSCSSEK
jgi:hypothetical protein